MPIPRKVLEEAARPLDQRILEFLGKSPDSAFSAVEIFSAIEGHDEGTANIFVAFQPDALKRYREVLGELVHNGLVVAQRYQGSHYYAVHRE